MLYIDQPVQVGFSYDELVHSTLDLLTGNISPTNRPIKTNGTFVPGVFPSQNPGATANTTANAARIMWQFSQIWLQEFPEHQSSNERVSVWANSVSYSLSLRIYCTTNLILIVWRSLGSSCDGALRITEPQGLQWHYQPHSRRTACKTHQP